MPSGTDQERALGNEELDVAPATVILRDGKDGWCFTWNDSPGSDLANAASVSARTSIRGAVLPVYVPRGTNTLALLDSIVLPYDSGLSFPWRPKRRRLYKPYLNHALSTSIRRHHRWWRPRRHRGCARQCADGAQHAAAHPQHRNPGPDVVQSVDRRNRQRSLGEGSRRPWRRDGDRDRRGRHPVPRSQFEQGSGGPRDPRPGRPGALQAGDPVAAREPAEPDAVPAGSRRPHARWRRGRRARDRGRDADRDPLRSGHRRT